MTLLLHPYAPSVRSSDQADTWMSLSLLRSARLPKLSIQHIECRLEHPSDYVQGVLSSWSYDGPIIINEMDIVPTVDMIKALIECSEDICTQAYTCYPASTGRRDTVLVQRRAKADGEPWEWIEHGDEFAGYTGLGLVKLGQTIRGMIDPEGFASEYGDDWGSFDSNLCHAIQAVTDLKARWHIHWPEVTHLHH